MGDEAAKTRERECPLCRGAGALVWERPTAGVSRAVFEAFEARIRPYLVPLDRRSVDGKVEWTP